MHETTTRSAARPAEPAAMGTGRLRGWMALRGVVELAAVIALLLFFALARPFGGIDFAWMWLGPLNDWLGVAAAVPECVTVVLVARAVRAGVAGRILGWLAVVSTIVGAVITMLMLGGVVPLEAQYAHAGPHIAIVFGWLAWAGLRLSAAGLLPRRTGRAAAAVAIAVAAGAALAGIGLVAPPVLAIGIGVGLLGWLAAPIWWLVAAARLRAPAASA